MNIKTGNLRPWGVILVIAVVFLVMNIYTPKIADDYYWEYISGTDKKVESIGDIFPSIYGYYMATPGTGITGGRVVAAFVTQLSVLLGKNVFNFLNALIYTALILLMHFHIIGSLKKINGLLYLTINILMWYLVPAWGENFLWLTGSCFYVWPLTIILLFLVPLRKCHDNPSFRMNIVCSVLYSFCGFFAGLSYENAGAGTAILLAAYFLTKKMKKENVKFFEMTGAIGFIIGFIILVIAPGNYVRLNSYELVHEYGFIKRLIIKFFDTTQIYFINYGVLLTGLCLILGIDRYQKKQKTVLFPLFYLAGGIVSAYSMILVPLFLNRVYFPVSVFLIIALLNYIVHTEIPDLIKRNARAFIILFMLIFSFSFAKAGTAIYKSYKGDPSLKTSERHYGQMQ